MASRLPPDAALYHSYVPPGAVAVSEVLLPAQSVVVPETVGAAGVAAAVTVAVCVMAAQPVVLSDTVTE